MSDDLISRRAVIEGIIGLLKSPYANDPHFGMERRDAMKTVGDLCVRSLPAAYDADKVVERIEAMRTFDCKMCDKDDESSMVCVYDCTEELIDQVIEIVREGVRMDDRDHDREHGRIFTGNTESTSPGYKATL